MFQVELVQSLVEFLGGLRVFDSESGSTGPSVSFNEFVLVKSTNVSAGEAVAFEVKVAFAGLGAVDVVGAGGVGVARIGLGVADICVAGNFVSEVTGGAFDGVVSLVEAVVTSAEKASPSLAQVESAWHGLRAQESTKHSLPYP